MRKNKLLIVLLLPILLLIPFSKNANAQVPGYVGVAAGEQYTWKVEAQFGNVDELLDNARSLLLHWKANLPTSFQLFGLEDLTVAEIYEQIATVYLSNILPVGWESLNITDLIEATIDHYMVQFNSTVLAGMIPSNWQALNFSDFYDLVFDALNTTMPVVWEDNPVPELLKMLINELNSTVYYGLVPAGWEGMTMTELYLHMITAFAPPIGESAVLHLMFNAFFPMAFPPEISTKTMTELFNEMMGTTPMNLTTLYTQGFLMLNQSMPGGMESESMANVIDYLGDMVNQSLPSEFEGLTSAELLTLNMEMMVNMTLPPPFNEFTIIQILDFAYTEAINMLDMYVIPGWDSTYLQLQAMGMASYEVGLRVEINSVGAEIETYPGGPKGAPINMDYLVSMDFEEWLDIETDLGVPFDFFPLMYFIYGFFYYGPPMPVITPLIVDPSTYTLVETALADQGAFTGNLILANNYDWGSIQPELTMVYPGNLDAIQFSTAWNNKGVLQSASVKTDGLTVAQISLIGGGPEPIPGYEISIILGISTIALIAIIFHLKRKNNIIK
ncbi:MAG: hypothetical protein ACFE88_14275 [Candidatus Hermodarchaeota archaeon]